MIETVSVILIFFIAILCFVWLADRIDIPAPILLVPAGIATAYIPDFPVFRLDPELVLLVFLPPLVYAGGFFSSWGELRKNLRPVILLSVGLVVFSTLATAWFVNHFIPGFGWVSALILGAIVSPPDDVAIIAIAEKIGLPERIVTVLEGEGLFNDATALTIFRFSLAAVTVASISPLHIAGAFSATVAGEILWGLALGWIMIRVRARCDNVDIDTILSLLTPYLAYIPADYLGGSGVLAAATAGIYMGRNGAKYLRFSVRMRGHPVWNLLSFVLNNSLFFLTGLQFRPVLSRLQDYSVDSLVLYGGSLCLAVIAIRFMWVFPASYLPRLFSKKLRRRDPYPPWQWIFLVAWSGMRGAISLAAALAIPVFMQDYTPFPQRDFIIFLTFCVIFGTLVLQGLGLQPLVKLLGIDCHAAGEGRRNEIAQDKARRHALQAALDKIGRWRKNKDYSGEVLKRLEERYGDALERLALDGKRRSGADGGLDAALELIAVEREALIELRHRGDLSDKQLREVERDLDLMEMQIHRGHRGAF